MIRERVFANSFYYMAASLLPTAVTFALLPVFTRYLSPGDYGILALVQSFTAFLPLILNLQLQSSISRFYFDYDHQQRRVLISTISVALLCLSSLALIILFIFLNQIIAVVFPKTPPSMYILFRLALITTFFNSLMAVFKVLLIVREKAKLFMTISLCLFFAGLIINIIEVVVLKKGAYGMVEASLIISVLSIVLFTFFNRRFFTRHINIAMLRGPLKYSLPLIPHALSGIIFMYSDRIIMEKYFPLAIIGLYSLADKVAMVFKTMVNQLNTAFQPHFMKTATADKNKALDDARRIAKTTVFFVSYLIAVAAVFSVEFVYYALDTRYFEAWIMIPILASCYVFRSLYCFESSGLFFEKRTIRIAGITAVAAIVNIAINVTLMPRYGVMVAVFSTLASHLVAYVMALLMSTKTFRVRLDNRSNLLFIAYLYGAIILSFFINSGFTLQNPQLPLKIYALKMLILVLGLCLGLKMRVLRFRASNQT